jgi:hypothetical protein
MPCGQAPLRSGALRSDAEAADPVPGGRRPPPCGRRDIVVTGGMALSAGVLAARRVSLVGGTGGWNWKFVGGCAVGYWKCRARRAVQAVPERQMARAASQRAGRARVGRTCGRCPAGRTRDRRPAGRSPARWREHPATSLRRPPQAASGGPRRLLRTTSTIGPRRSAASSPPPGLTEQPAPGSRPRRPPAPASPLFRRPAGPTPQRTSSSDRLSRTNSARARNAAGFTRPAMQEMIVSLYQGIFTARPRTRSAAGRLPEPTSQDRPARTDQPGPDRRQDR